MYLSGRRCRAGEASDTEEIFRPAVAGLVQLGHPAQKRGRVGIDKPLAHGEQLGEFSALPAIIAYAFVPAAVRYSEHGLRNLPEHVIEAAKMMESTKWQVKVPLALPVMMLGLNQTIMFAIAMLVIAALEFDLECGWPPQIWCFRV
ncbi:MAG: ABC transporter permease subunit, partial [Albidovulum sp.]|nr:ABC transporter permease subunit [Albidovulum sp.]